MTATMSHVRYRAWDGTQSITPLAPEQVLAALSDDLLSGNIEQALDRALHRGLTDPDGDQIAGLDQLRDALRAKRRKLEQSLANDEQLQQLADALRSGNSTEGLDADTSDLLEALAAHPDAARIMAHLPADSRALAQAALDQIVRRGPLDREGGDLDDAPAFSGTLADTLTRLNQLDDLEQAVRRVRKVADIAEIDPALVRAALGEHAADAIERLTASLQTFADSGFVRGPGGKQELSARALQHIGDEILTAVLARLASRQPGDRRLLHRPGIHDLTGTSRDYQFGDPLSLDLSRTVLQAVRRGSGTPVRLDPADFAIFEREDSARAATVLAIDLSRSMGERGYLLAAKRLALALTTLIRTRFPRDILLLTGFSESARPLTPAELPRLAWDRFGFGTNIQDALRLGRVQLAAHRGMQRNLILLTDGEPTAYRDPDGRIHFNHPPTPETLAATYAEADRLRRDGASLAVCVLSDELQVVRFAEELTRRTSGDLIVTAPDDLASAITLHYGRHRKR
jgi:uncharacterized protein with von Willebrand factor type A (vWA) domain